MSWFRHHPEPPDEATVVVERRPPSPFWIGVGVAAGLAAAALITWAVVKPKDGGRRGEGADFEGPIA